MCYFRAHVVFQSSCSILINSILVYHVLNFYQWTTVSNREKYSEKNNVGVCVSVCGIAQNGK